MSPEWLNEVARFVDVLEGTQQELLATLRLKRRALVSGDSRELEELTQAALDLSQRLRTLGTWREQLLSQTRAAGHAGRTLMDVLDGQAGLDADRLRGRLKAVQQRFGETQREAWIHWVIAQRAGLCYSDLLDLLARGGQRSPVYGDGTVPIPATGGAMLDAAV